MEVQGNVFDIKRFAVHDGPGIRTTVFLKGCPLRCEWCHNPESQSCNPVLAQYRDNCIGCGECLKVCPAGAVQSSPEGIVIDRQLCRACGTCAAVCHAQALVVRGSRMSVSEVLAEVEKDRVFYENSGGGVTFSGGEPLYQPEFLRELLKAARASGLHTCVDTCGYASWDTLEDVLQYVDMVLYDIKGVNPHLHRLRTGRPNAMILQNLRTLMQNGKDVVVRTPIIPGYNDSRSEVEQLAQFLMELNRLPRLEMLPYHRMGEGKKTSLGMTAGPDMEPPDRDRLEELADILRTLGVECTVGG